MLKKLLYSIVLLLVLATSHSPLATAQSTSASLTGLVEDPSKALIPGATITAINTQTGEKASTTTNKEGQYVLPGLNPGTYRLEVDKPGFKGIIEAGLTLHVQDAVQINFHMAIGSSSESVTVNADQININTTDGTVSTVIDQSYIANMPLNGRSFQDLILLTPGVVTASPQGIGNQGLGGSGEFSVNGQRTEENYYTVDGVSANVGAGSLVNMTLGAGASGSLGASTALGTTQALASVDDLQEFRVQSSSYSAEYGHNPGGQFAFETKSGSKQVHGSAFDYLRNGYFDAPDWFNDYYGIPEPALHQNDFGGTVGGPLQIPKLIDVKDRTYFFYSYEGLRLISPQPAAISCEPDAATRASAAPALQPVFNSFAVPNGSTCGDDFGQYIASWSNPSSINSTSIRLDHTINDKEKLFFRFSNTDSNSATRSVGSVNDVTSMPFSMQTYTTGLTSVISNRIANDFHLNYSSNHAVQDIASDAFGGGAPFDIYNDAQLNPSVLTYFLYCNNDYCVDIYNGIYASAQRQWNLIDTLSVSKGHHSLKFGVDYRRLTPILGTAFESAVWVFVGPAENGGSPNEVEQNLCDSCGAGYNITAYPLYQNFSAFAQDEWRISNRLSLSIGLRWDVNPSPGVTHGTLPYTVEGTNDPNTATLAPYGTPLYRTTWFNLAPRLGVAYLFRNEPGRELVVRAGGGVFFDSGQQLGSQGFNDGPGQESYNQLFYAPFPELPVPPPIVNDPQPPYNNYGNIYGFDPHLQLPYTLQWNLSIQQALGKMQSLTLSYVASHASRLLQSDAVTPSNNPNFTNGGGYQIEENGGISDYNSLQAQFQRRLSAGLTALLSYTWSHCEDDGSSNFYFGYQKGNCDMDVRQNLAAAASYDIPAFTENKFVKGVLGHWGMDNRLTARTAFPVTLTGYQMLHPYPNLQTYDAGLNIVPGQPIYLYGENCTSTFLALGAFGLGGSCPGGRGINPNAFVVDPTGIGDAPRNFARGFGAFQLDTAIRREFPIKDQWKLQFRAEAFNLFNHPNLGNINGQFGQNNFGLATATLANSLGVLSPLYQMGGPRSMQFALRLAF